MWRQIAWHWRILLFLEATVFIIGVAVVIPDNRVVAIDANIAESGGFAPVHIEAHIGETITFRFTANDTAHSVAIGPGLGVETGIIPAFETRWLTVTFREAGVYTFYCNFWCSAEHWRMRGTITVYAADGQVPPTAADPIIAALTAEGVDIDAVHTTTSTNHHATQHEHAAAFSAPSPAQGAALAATTTIPPELQTVTGRRSYTPAAAVALLQAANHHLSTADAQQVMAYLWQQDSTVTPATITLYSQNCAACHGVFGDGQGIGSATTLQPPPAFTDVAHMLTMRSDVLYAKIRRGGMGTDMPNFGTIFTPDETWALVDYIWQLAFATAP
jgi:plastocyanin